jgi:hypothetical protein
MRALANPNHHSHLQTEAILESYQKSCPNRSVHLSIGCEFGNATRSWLSSLSTSRQNLKQSDLFFNQETVVYKIEHPLFGRVKTENSAVENQRVFRDEIRMTLLVRVEVGVLMYLRSMNLLQEKIG